jgi:hypothetical protein
VGSNPTLSAEDGGLVLIGKAAVLKTAGLLPMGVRVPRPPQYNNEGEL